MNKTAATVNEIKSILEADDLKESNYLKESGEVFSTGYLSLKKSKFYLLGLNPGTGTKEMYLDPKYSIEYHLDKFLTSPSGFFLNDGKSKYYPRLKYLLTDILSTDENSVCVSNLFFTRSSGQKTANFSAVAQCFKVHKKLILDIIKPEIIIVLGRGTYFLLKKLLTDDLWEFEGSRQSDCPAGHGNWKVFFREFTNKDNQKTLKVVNVPHLSWYAINKGKEEAIRHIREFCR